ncbi:ribonuclease E inhibitor RraB [Massilia sp. TSP1-1-2]|uniref:ribonuclease E inhibitor RraB n=1 Tax=unclassified Massilia TaxID=2609279 RepID=UPI003CEF703C
MIDLEQIKAMFANVGENAGWDLAQPMEWGYFFTDRKRAKLESALKELQKLGFRYVDIFIPQLEKGQEDYFFLHVVKVDVHTPESLFAQNARLYELAAKHELDSYDGMDVGPITPK